MATMNVSLPALYPSRFNRMSHDEIKRNDATIGISMSNRTIAYHAAHMARLIAEGTLTDKLAEFSRLDLMNGCTDTIAFHERKIAKYKKVLASLPPEQDED
jgi:hypothetical protein